jgi:hypothetical protein
MVHLHGPVSWQVGGIIAENGIDDPKLPTCVISQISGNKKLSGSGTSFRSYLRWVQPQNPT